MSDKLTDVMNDNITNNEPSIEVLEERHKMIRTALSVGMLYEWNNEEDEPIFTGTDKQWTLFTNALN